MTGPRNDALIRSVNYSAKMAIAALMALMLWVSGLQPAFAQQARGQPVAVVLEIDGAIGPATAGYVGEGLESAAAEGAELVILRMNTPGGLASSMRDIISDMLASPVPIATYVAPGGARAASAGTYILYASQVAAMAPGTNLGAATPVRIGGAPPEDDASGEAPAASEAKAINDAVAYIRSLAELHGRNAEWAERAVREAASLSASAALEDGIIEIIADDLDDLLTAINGRQVQLGGERTTLETENMRVEEMEPNWRYQVLSVLTNPNVAYILMLIGIYGIIFEFISPGAIVPGVTGAISLLLALFALNLLPLNFAGAGLLVLGIALIVAEAFVPSFGILGIGGTAAFALGSLFMFDEVPGFELSISVVATATAASIVLLAIILAAAVRAHRRRIVSGASAMVGETGTVMAWSDRRGQIHVHGERWQARSESVLVPGTFVTISGRENLVLIVEPKTSTET